MAIALAYACAHGSGFAGLYAQRSGGTFSRGTFAVCRSGIFGPPSCQRSGLVFSAARGVCGRRRVSSSFVGAGSTSGRAFFGPNC